jgi:hypothetical protein
MLDVRLLRSALTAITASALSENGYRHAAELDVRKQAR